MVWTEMFDVPWYPGESLITVTLTTRRRTTRKRPRPVVSQQAARDGVLRTNMERGVGLSYGQTG